MKGRSILLFPLLGAFLLAACSTLNERQGKSYPITALDIRDVKLNDPFWLSKIRTIQDSTVAYSFAKCEEEGRMENFLIAGREMEGETRGHMPFDDTDLYKLIEGASNTLISKPNPELETYLDSIIDIIGTGQEEDGYLTTWFTIDRKNPPAWWVAPSEKRWENEISSHELYNSGHLFEAAVVHHRATGKENFLDIALKNADLLVENFGPGKLHTPPGHQIVETGLLKLYAVTGKEDYRDLARFFLDIRGDSTSHELFGPYSQDHLPVTEQTEAVGHAVRAVYMYAAMTDVAVLYGDENYMAAVHALWESVTHRKMYLTGGIGSRHDGEAFGDDFELPNLTAYGETCASIGNIDWNHRLFLMSGEVKYYDVIERTLYNGLLSGLSLSGKEFFYPNPLESDGAYKFNHGVSCTRSSWFDCSCCPTNLVRFIPSMPDLIYARRADTLYVNLYASSTAVFSVGGQEVRIMQQTSYPWEGEVLLEVESEKPLDLVVKLRIPGWARGEVLPGGLYTYIEETERRSGIGPELKINGNKLAMDFQEGYATLDRRWNHGDHVELSLPMTVRKVRSDQKIAGNLGLIALERGPLVYCAEEVDNPEFDPVLSPEDSFTSRQIQVRGEQTLLLERDKLSKPLTLVPYYLWSNRGEGRMKVWIPQE